MKKFILFLTVSTSLVFAQGYKIGDEAKDFSLKNIDGNMVSLKNNREAKGFIIVFTCNHCPFAQAYEQRIIDLDKKFKPLGYPVIAINPNDPAIVPDDSFDNMVKTAKDKSYTFPYLFDETQQTAKAFGATKTPHVYVLSKNKMKLTVSYIGAIDNNTDNPDKADKKYVEDAVNELLSGKTVTVTETKAIGCGIKWKK
jgi:peroxiredoxin